MFVPEDDVLLVFRLARRRVEVHGRHPPVRGAPLGAGLLLAGAHAGRLALVVVEHGFRVLRRPPPRRLGARQQVERVRIQRLVRQAVDHDRGEREGDGPRQRRMRRRRPVHRRRRRRGRRAGRLRAEDRQQTAAGGAILHLLLPLQPPDDLVDEVRDAVAGLGQAGSIVPGVRVLEPGVHQRDQVVCVPGRVAVEVAGVVPAARQVAGRGFVFAPAVQPRPGVLERPRVARAVLPGGLGVRRLLREAGTLVEEGPQCVPEHRPVDIRRDRECRRAQAVFRVRDVVASGYREIREIEPPDPVARELVEPAPVPGRRVAAEHGLPRRRRDDLQFVAGAVVVVAVETELGIAEHRYFLRVREVSELVDRDERGHLRFAGAADAGAD